MCAKGRANRESGRSSNGRRDSCVLFSWCERLFTDDRAAYGPKFIRHPARRLSSLDKEGIAAQDYTVHAIFSPPPIL